MTNEDLKKQHAEILPLFKKHARDILREYNFLNRQRDLVSTDREEARIDRQILKVEKMMTQFEKAISAWPLA